MAPTIALKFFRDGMSSANLFAQTPTNSQPGNYNFFANTLQNVGTIAADSDEVGKKIFQMLSFHIS